MHCLAGFGHCVTRCNLSDGLDMCFHCSAIVTLLFFSPASAAAKALTVSDETEKTMRVKWQAAPGRVLNYRVTYTPQSGGRQLSVKVPHNMTSTVLKKLQPMTTYDITVHPIYRHGEGKARQGVGTTRTLAHNSKPISHRRHVCVWVCVHVRDSEWERMRELK